MTRADTHTWRHTDGPGVLGGAEVLERARPLLFSKSALSPMASQPVAARTLSLVEPRHTAHAARRSSDAERSTSDELRQRPRKRCRCGGRTRRDQTRAPRGRADADGYGGVSLAGRGART